MSLCFWYVTPGSLGAVSTYGVLARGRFVLAFSALAHSSLAAARAAGKNKLPALPVSERILANSQSAAPPSCPVLATQS